MLKSAPSYRLKDRELGRPTSSQRYKTCARCGAHRDFERAGHHVNRFPDVAE